MKELGKLKPVRKELGEKEIGQKESARKKLSRKFAETTAQNSKFKRAHTIRRDNLPKIKYRPEVCRDLCRDSPAKSENPPNNFPSNMEKRKTPRNQKK